MSQSRYQYDVFISHAVEDKLALANELHERLCATGLKVWYSGVELSVGDRLADTIFKGLDQCRFGVVIISPTYISKIWAMAEFFALFTREIGGHKVVLPVLLDITPEEVAIKSPLMADIYAIPASKGVDAIVEKVCSEIEKQTKKRSTKSPFLHWKKIALAACIAMFIAAISFLLITSFSSKPDKELIDQTIQHRIVDIQNKANVAKEKAIQNGAVAVSSEEVKKLYTDFTNVKSYYRNEFILATGSNIIRARKNVEATLLIDFDNSSPLNNYTFPSPEIYRSYMVSPQGYRNENLTFSNTVELVYKIDKTENLDNHYIVHVVYTNPVRLISTNLIFPSSANNNTRRQQVAIIALPPTETYSFSTHDDTWTLDSVQ